MAEAAQLTSGQSAPPLKAKRRRRQRKPTASTSVPKRAWSLRDLEAAGLGKETFWYQRIAQGDVIAHKLGGKLVIFSENLEACLTQCPRATSRYRARGRAKA